jgi:transcriptional regulator of acetoin/glycerol metabolism
MIREAVNQARGNVAEAARTLGISRATVYRKLSAPKG